MRFAVVEAKLSTVIERLQLEHWNTARLLDALDRQMGLLSRAAGPNYEVLRGIADYFCDYPDRCHHPTENLVFKQLETRDPGAAARIGDLVREHSDCGARARRFRENIQALFRDEIRPRTTIVSAARSFIDAERKHMEMEERVFFPLAEKALTPEDWREIESRLGHERDPLAAENVENAFRSLRELLLDQEAISRSR